MFQLEGKRLYAHRIAYALAHDGEIPDGKMIDHACHVRHCVNPMHLRAVTNKQNSENRSGPNSAASGYRGVQRYLWGFRGVTRHNYKHYYTPTVTTPEAANEAVIELRNRLHSNNILDRQHV